MHKINNQSLRGTLLHHEPLSKHTTWRVGGTADRFYKPADLADLQQFLAQLPSEEPLFWLGLGSNLLVRDGGIRGTVIATVSGLSQIENLGGGCWSIQAGVPCAKIARQTARAGWTGGEFLAGIPGAWGGALAMNAGAWGGETWALLESVQTINHLGILRMRQPEDYEVAYRHVAGFADEYFVAATLKLQAEAVNVEQSGSERIKKLLQQRKQSQPTGLPSCGSVFRNPKPLFAARLIEDCGLKGKRIGGAQVSEKHANFIINTGNATAMDIEKLIQTVQATVEEVKGMKLHPEVHIIGVFL